MNKYQEKNNELWLEKYECAKHYYVENGNLLIPGTYETNDGVKLGMWISHQRRDYLKDKLSNDRIELLEAIGMIWSVYDAQWFDYYRFAVQYYNENSNLLIPRLYTASNGVKLGSWLGAQRRQYKDGKLSEDRTKLLEKIGMVWSVDDIQWYENYNLAIEYYNVNGNLLVPLRYKTTNNINLGSWISGQRKKFKAGRLSTDKIELLERIGMVWDVKKQARDIYIKALKDYFKKFNNIDIPSTYVKNGIKLGSWIEDQRDNYRHNKIDQSIKKVLDKYNFKVNVFEERWNEMYEIAKKYYKINKTLWISPNYIDENNVHLGCWISTQRKKFLNKNSYTELELKQINLLNQIGMVWNPYDKLWMTKYNLAKTYYKKHGNLNIPRDYIVDGVKLGSWICTQRQANRGNPNYRMTKERKKLLEEIHMNFNLRNPKNNARKRDNFL